MIRGTQDAVHQAELMVRKVIVDQPPIVSDTLTVPGNSVGRIIGQFLQLFIVTFASIFLLTLPAG